jgi:predicted nucleic acid-binding protein
VRPVAVLDTSFWSVGFKVGLLGYAMRAFEIVVPRAVEAEIRAVDARYPRRLYPDTALFDQVRDRFQDPPDPEPDPLDRFGAGEAAAIAVARHLGSVVLINDRRPAELARNLGLAVVSCPGLIVLATRQELIANHIAQAMLRMCAQHGTSPVTIKEAMDILQALQPDVP